MTGRVDNASRKIALGRSKSINQKTHRLVDSSTQDSNCTPSNDHVVIDNESTIVAITVKRKGHNCKNAGKSPCLSNCGKNGNTVSNVIAGDKKRESSLNENHNWAGILREQNKTAIKQSLGELSTVKMVLPKTGRTVSRDCRDPRKTKITEKSPNIHSTTNPSARSVSNGNSTESIIVIDKAVQCGETLYSSSSQFNHLNPVRTLDFLVKELKSSIKDEKSNEILFQIEKVLRKIPVGPDKPVDVLQSITMQTRLEASTAKLAATSLQMEGTVEVLRQEKAVLQQKIEEQFGCLQSAKSRETELEDIIRDMQVKLDEAMKFELTSKKLMDEVKEKNEKIQVLHGVITQLKTELNEQIQLAQQRFVEAQYLKIEKEKLSVMSSFKDSQLAEHRKVIKNMQNLIGDQLINMKKTRSDDSAMILEQEVSKLIVAGRTSSSPMSISPNKSVAALSEGNAGNISDLSISTIHPPILSEEKFVKHLSSKLDALINEPEYQLEKLKGKTQLEFTSLGGDEASQTASTIKSINDQPIYVGLETANSFAQDKQQNDNCDKANSSKSRFNPAFEDEKSVTIRSKLKKKSDEQHVRDLNNEKNIKEQIHMLYQNTRINSQFKVNIPSPPRNYPYPDWSDSSLPTMSISDSTVL